jgi:hypothetical protein
MAAATMSQVTGRCYDFPGPAEPVIATNGGWLPLTEHTAEDVARSTMLLACSPEHIDALRADTAEHPVAPPVGSVDRPR